MERADIVFSGMRPTGRLHIGNYWGALKNWVDLQDRFPCFFCVADWHMLTTGYNDTSKLRENCREMVLDWLAAGLDPAKCVIFRQSDVSEHAELALMLGMVTPLAMLEHNPTWKEQLQELAKTKAGMAAAGESIRYEENKQGAGYELRTFGFLGYPVLQAADILLYHGTKVPVGRDQLPHLELSREIARKFNNAFGPIFAEPQPLLTPTPKVPGADARKMSKSYGNAIDIGETAASLEAKVKGMYTDPTRKSATDPGHPEPCPDNERGCAVFALHKLYASESFVRARGADCRAGKLGCMACKKDLLCEMSGPFEVFRARRDSYRASDVEAVLAEGALKARAAAQKTMVAVRRAMRLR
ncbi:MAG: tryptophan--tRNA ligase [Elusimicrobia bacterium GWC2_65_9]|nr:MAG: tryptophan--tRNA ligase [Elusimicrobia bacterium GWA2_66_18]OGR74976.1 MAG: tryptophan--tRNA ligase [Elusimicrobia bacterium GWC2_65_9]